MDITSKKSLLENGLIAEGQSIRLANPDKVIKERGLVVWELLQETNRIIKEKQINV